MWALWSLSAGDDPQSAVRYVRADIHTAEIERLTRERDEARARAAGAYEAAAQICDDVGAEDAARVIRGVVRSIDEDALVAADEDAIERAKREEREACARVVERFAGHADRQAEVDDPMNKILSKSDARRLRIVADAIRKMWGRDEKAAEPKPPSE
jgi:hypothetical protein